MNQETAEYKILDKLESQMGSGDRGAMAHSILTWAAGKARQEKNEALQGILSRLIDSQNVRHTITYRAIPLTFQELGSKGEFNTRKLSVRRSVHRVAFLGKVVEKKPRMASVKSLKWA